MGKKTVQGSNYDPLYTITNEDDGSAIDVSSALITYTVKEIKLDEAPLSFEKKNLAAGGNATQIEMGPANNQFTVHVLPADTSGITTTLDKEYWTETKISISGSIIKEMETLYIEQSLTA